MLKPYKCGIYKHTNLINSCVHTGMDSEGRGVEWSGFYFICDSSSVYDEYYTESEIPIIV